MATSKMKTPKMARKSSKRKGGSAVVTANKARTPSVKREAVARKQGVSRRGAPGRFSKLTRAQGWGVTLLVAEHTAEGWDLAENTAEGVTSVPRGKVVKKGRSTKGASTTGKGGKITRSTVNNIQRTCAAFAAMGHAQRVVLLAKLLEGPATYSALQKATKIKVGPLYHHINQLRLAGLILPKQRDLYELTRGGRNLILTAVAAGPLLADKRRRP